MNVETRDGRSCPLRRASSGRRGCEPHCGGHWIESAVILCPKDNFPTDKSDKISAMTIIDNCGRRWLAVNRKPILFQRGMLCRGGCGTFWRLGGNFKFRPRLRTRISNTIRVIQRFFTQRSPPSSCVTGYTTPEILSAILVTNERIC